MNIMTYYEKLIEDLNSKPNHVLSKSPAVFYFISKEDGIISGVNEIEAFLSLYDISIGFRKHKESGQPLKRGDIVCSLQGPTDSLYHVLPVIKHMLGKMTGIASMVHYYQSKLQQARVIDFGQYMPLYDAIDQIAYKDGGALLTKYYVVTETMIDLESNIEDAVNKAKLLTEQPIAIEINDIAKFYDALATNTDAIIIKYFNDEAIRRAVLDNKGKKIIIVGGLILPNRLDIIGSYQFDYLYSSLFEQASRIYDFAVKVGK